MSKGAYDKIVAGVMAQFKESKKPRLMAEVVTVKGDKDASR